MSKFVEVMSKNPPHLAVKYQQDDEGKDHFAWRMQGSMPLMSLIGFVGHRVLPAVARGTTDPVHLCASDPGGGRMLVVAWTGERFQWFVDMRVPRDPLCGMLETIKAVLIQTSLNQQAQQAMRQQAERPVEVRTPLLGPNGQPLR